MTRTCFRRGALRSCCALRIAPCSSRRTSCSSRPTQPQPAASNDGSGAPRSARSTGSQRGRAATEPRVVALLYRAEEHADDVLVPLYDLLVREGVPFELVAVANY